MTLRDEIRDALMTYENDIRSVASGAEYQDTTTAAADAILAKVREALLNNEVQAPIRHELHHYPRTSTRDTVKTVIEMALDAVTGEGGER